MKKPKIVAIHLFNDYSGSPLVFAQALRTLVTQGHEVDLYTSKSKQSGFLSDIEGINYHYFNYKWSKLKVLTLIRFIMSQTGLLFKLLKYRRKDVIFYINTILPFGASLAANFMHKPLVYHIHETSIKPLFLKKFLFKIIDCTADKIIYVSHFLKQQEPIKHPKSYVVHNALSAEFVKIAESHYPKKDQTFTVLMLASLKEYKGVLEFVELAQKMPKINFELVLNAPEEDIAPFFADIEISPNTTLYPSQKNVHPFYQRANLVLNLSHPDKWVETFGMTALEAMSYGIPVIVPPVGGIAEIVNSGYDGYKIDVRQTKTLIDKISLFKNDHELYRTFSAQARKTSKHFTAKVFSQHIYSVFSE